jgi:TP901 family phage tail tape measure protein
MASASRIRAAKAYVEFFLDATKLDAGLKTVSERLKKIGSEMREASSKIALGVAPIAAAIGVSVKQFASFDDVMRMVISVSGAAGNQIGMLRDKAAELGKETSFSSAEVGEAMLNLARAGFKPNEIANMIGPMLDLARASGTDLAQSADIAAVAMRAFGLSATEAERAADVLVATANNSAQTVGDLGEALKYVAPVAADAGMSLEDTALTIGIMANYGIRGSMAGTAMRQSLLRLADPNIQRQMQQVFGVIVTDGQGNIRKLHEVLKDLDKSMAGLTASERVANMQQLFNLRGMTVGLKVGQADLKQLDDAIRNAQGTAQRTADEIDEGLGGGFRRLSGAVESAALSLGNALAPALIPIISAIDSGISLLAEWIAQHQTWAVVIASVTAGIVGLTATIYALGTAIGALSAALGVLRVAMQALSTGNIVIIAITAVATLIGGVVALVGWLRRGKQEVKETKDANDELAKAQAAAAAAQADAQKKLEAERRKAAAQQAAQQQKLKTQQVLDFEKSMEERIHQTRIGLIEDELQREIAGINARYQKEMEKAKELGADQTKVQKAWAAEVEAAKIKAARERAEREKRERERLEEERQRFTEDIDQQLAEARIDATLEGTEKELAKLNLEKQRALAEAAQLGVNPAQIEELYRLREETIRKSQMPDITAAARFTSGFSGFAVLAQGAGPAAETAKNTAKMTKQLAELNGLLNKNLQFN